MLIAYSEKKAEYKLPVWVNAAGCDYRWVNAGGTDYRQTGSFGGTCASSQIIFTLSGRGELTGGDSFFALEAGDIFYLKKGTDFSLKNKDGDWTVDFISFDFEENSFDGTFLDKECLILPTEEFESCRESVKKICREVSFMGADGEKAASAILYDIIVKLDGETAGRAGKLFDLNRNVERMIDYIDANFAKDISLEELCRAAGGMSEQYVCRLFKQNIGMRPLEYIIKKRVWAARLYLEMSEIDINDAAYLSGFNNISYFYRNFKKFTGMSPLEYRKKMCLREKVLRNDTKKTPSDA